MRYAPVLLCVIGLLGVLFALWGVNTASGRRTFDEMAGMIPMAAGVLGVISIAVGLVWQVVRFRS